jgi:hypothetical protein
MFLLLIEIARQSFSAVVRQFMTNVLNVLVNGLAYSSGTFSFLEFGRAFSISLLRK